MHDGSRVFCAAWACALLAACATDPALDEAKRIVDRAQPLRCEVFRLERALSRTPRGSVEAARLAARLDKARRAWRAHGLATMDEYIAVMKKLPFEQRKVVYRYSEAASARCSGREPAGPSSG